MERKKMIPADENLSVLKALEYGGELQFGDKMIYMANHHKKGLFIVAQGGDVKPKQFKATKEGLYNSLKHLQ